MVLVSDVFFAGVCTPAAIQRELVGLLLLYECRYSYKHMYFRGLDSLCMARLRRSPSLPWGERYFRAAPGPAPSGIHWKRRCVHICHRVNAGPTWNSASSGIHTNQYYFNKCKFEGWLVALALSTALCCTHVRIMIVLLLYAQIRANDACNLVSLSVSVAVVMRSTAAAVQ